MQAAGLSTSSTQVLVLHPTTLSDVLGDISSIATAAGVPQRAQQFVAELRARLQVVAAAVRRLCPPAAAVTVDQTTVAGNSVRQQQAEPLDTTGTDPAGSSAAAAGGPAGAAAAAGTHGAACQCVSFDGAAANQAASQSAVGLPAALQPWQHAPRVLSLEGLNPLVLGGQWLPDVKLAAGAVDASGQQPGDAPTRISWDQVCVCVWGGGGGCQGWLLGILWGWIVAMSGGSIFDTQTVGSCRAAN